jgi:hypothetical protein
MARRYKYESRIDRGGDLDDAFDNEPRERLSTCSSGPVTLTGRVNGVYAKVLVCSNGEEYACGRTPQEARNLARRIEKKCAEKM